MAFQIKVRTLAPSAFNPEDNGGALIAEYSHILSLTPEYILQEIIRRIADRFVEEHYAEIEKEIDPKLVAAVTAARMGAAVEEKMQKEISRVQEIANQALRRAKR